MIFFVIFGLVWFDGVRVRSKEAFGFQPVCSQLIDSLPRHMRTIDLIHSFGPVCSSMFLEAPIVATFRILAVEQQTIAKQGTLGGRWRGWRGGGVMASQLFGRATQKEPGKVGTWHGQRRGGKATHVHVSYHQHCCRKSKHQHYH